MKFRQHRLVGLFGLALFAGALGCVSTANAAPLVTVEDGRILFTSTRDGGDRDIFIADSDGSNPVNLTEGSPAEDHDPVIREDGDRIVFVSDRDGGDSDIFVMSVDGSDPVNLTSNSTAEDREPVIAGKLRRWIFFSSNRDGDYDIYSMEIDGASLADQWTPEGVPPSNETAPWVTPHAVAGVSLFTTTDRFGGDLDIMEQGHNYTPDSDGDDTNHGGFVPRPINERLSFYADVFQSDRDGDADVYIDDDPTIDLVGAENLTGDAPGFDGLPAVSPSGRRIAFTSDRSGGDRDVFTMGSDGSAPINLTSDSAAGDEAPAWETVYRCQGRRVTILGAFGTVFAHLHPQGTSGDDVFYGFTFEAGAGDDVACGSLHGGDGSEISGEKGDDRIFGSQSRDRLVGGRGDDRLSARRGRDVLYGGRGRDVLRGGGQDDVCIGGPGKDRLVGCEFTRLKSPRKAG